MTLTETFEANDKFFLLLLKPRAKVPKQESIK